MLIIFSLKGGVFILQIPTNVYPDNEVVVIDKHKTNGEYDNAPQFSYTFHGDQLRWAFCQYIDNTTEEVVGNSYFPKGGNLSTIYNGDTVKINEAVFNDIATNGNDYKYRYTLFQTNPTTGLGDYNIYFSRGKIIEAKTNNAFTIQKDIENIINRETYNSTVVGGAIIEICKPITTSGTTKITKERVMIDKYNKYTGEVTLNGSFTFTPAVGDIYRIFTNYIKTPYYYVKCRTKPQLKISVGGENGRNYNIKCNGEYSQAQNVGMKCYQYSLYELINVTNHETYNVISVADSYNIKIKSGLTISQGDLLRVYKNDSRTESKVYTILSYDSSTGAVLLDQIVDFEVNAECCLVSGTKKLLKQSPKLYNYDLSWNFNEFHSGKLILPTFTVWTQENVMAEISLPIQCDVISASSRVLFDDGSNVKTEYKRSVGMKYSWLWSAYVNGKTTNRQEIVVQSNRVNHTNVIFWNNLSNTKDWYTNENEIIAVYRSEDNSSDYQYLGDYTINKKYFIDYTACTEHKYKYKLIFTETMIQVDTELFETKFDGWTISSLKEINSPIPEFRIDKIWHSNIGIDSGDIVSVMGVQFNEQTGIKPSVTRFNQDYEQGTFTTYVSAIECKTENFDDDIYKVKAWKQFITGDNPFLLKSVKGDCWIVNIIDNPTRNYDESVMQLLTSVTYQWAECENIDNSLIKG